MFLNVFWHELFRLSGTKFISSTNYHPKKNEKTEIVNKWVEGYLQNYVSGQKRTWIKRFHLGENCYNTTYHMSIVLALKVTLRLREDKPNTHQSFWWMLVLYEWRSMDKTQYMNDVQHETGQEMHREMSSSLTLVSGLSLKVSRGKT
jgi:hypothetical protein